MVRAVGQRLEPWLLFFGLRGHPLGGRTIPVSSQRPGLKLQLSRQVEVKVNSKSTALLGWAHYLAVGGCPVPARDIGKWRKGRGSSWHLSWGAGTVLDYEMQMQMLMGESRGIRPQLHHECTGPLAAEPRSPTFTPIPDFQRPAHPSELVVSHGQGLFLGLPIGPVCIKVRVQARHMGLPWHPKPTNTSELASKGVTAENRIAGIRSQSHVAQPLRTCPSLSCKHPFRGHGEDSQQSELSCGARTWEPRGCCIPSPQR